MSTAALDSSPAALGPPEAVPTTLRGALKTLPTFLRHNLGTVLVSAIAAGVIGWVVNVWMLAVRFEGNNDVPAGSPVTGQNNTNWAVMFWVLFSMVLFGGVGYARAVGMRQFLYDLRTTPRVLLGLIHRDGARARIHLLWGAAVALLLGLAVPPAIAAVVSVGILATLPTIIGAICGSVLGRLFTGVLKPFRPGAQPLGMEAMIVGLVGSGLALALAFVVPSKGVRAAIAGICIIVAFVLARQLKARSAALVAVAAIAVYQALRWVLEAKQVLADDGGFAECGLDFGTWWRACEGAGAVRRQAVPGGVASAFGAPIGVFFGMWAGAVSKSRPAFLRDRSPRHPAPRPSTQTDTNIDVGLSDHWRDRPSAWHPATGHTLDVGSGSPVWSASDAHGHQTVPWMVGGEHPATIDPIAHPHSFDWRTRPPTDPFGAATQGTDAASMADRLNTLHRYAPTPQHLAEVRQFFDRAPHQSLHHTLEDLGRIEADHRATWGERLTAADSRLDADLHHMASSRLEALHELSLDHALPRDTGNFLRVLQQQQHDRFGEVGLPPSGTTTSVEHLFHVGHATSSGPAAPVADTRTTTERLEASLVEMQRYAATQHAMSGHTTALAAGHHDGLPHGGAVGIAGTGMSPGPATPFTGVHGLQLGEARCGLPLTPGSQLVETLGGHALVTQGHLGTPADLGTDASHARATISAPDHLDRFAHARGVEQAGELIRRFDGLAARTHQLDAMQSQMRHLQEMHDRMQHAGMQQVQQPDPALGNNARLEQLQLMQRQMHEVQSMHTALSPAAQQEQLVEVAQQIAADPQALRQLALHTPWRAGDLVHAIRPGPDTELPITRSVLRTDADLAWFQNHHRDLAMTRADHTELAQALGPSAAPQLVTDLQQMQHTMQRMTEQRVSADAMDRMTEMRQMLDEVVQGRMQLATADSLAQQRFDIGILGLTAQVQLAFVAQLGQEADPDD